MEVSGLVVGVAGLAGLLEATISAFDRVDKFRQYGSTSRHLQTRFENQKFFLEEIRSRLTVSTDGAVPGSNHRTSAVSDPRRKRRIEETLICIRESLEAISHHFKKHARGASPALAIPLHDAAQDAVGSPARVKTSRFRRLRWAIGDKERLTEQVDWFETMVQALDQLIPAAHDPVATPTLTSASLPAGAIESARSWLNATSTKAVRDQYTACRTNGTCEWILERQEYRDWMDPEARCRTLWLHAPPGYGKSVTSAALTEHMELIQPNVVVSYFCSANQEELRMPYNVLRSCLTQVMLHDPQLLHLVEESRHKSDSGIATESELWSMFSTMLRTGAGFSLILDGFDECYGFESESHRRSGLSRAYFLSQLRASFSDTPSRLLIVSRDQADIRVALGCASMGFSSAEGSAVEYSIKREDVHSDIARLARTQIETNFSQRPMVLRDELTEHLTENSDGMFLWVRLQSMQLKPNMSTTRLRKQMADMPPDLHRIYEGDWQRVISLPNEERDWTLLILRWVTYAVRPLTALELLEALGTDSEGSPFAAVDGWSTDQVLTDDIINQQLLEPCRPFLSLRQNEVAATDGTSVIQSAHFSMKTFLSAKLCEHADQAQLQIPDGSLAMICLEYISTGLPWINSIPRTAEVKDHPFLTYAAQHWMTHLGRVPTQNEDMRSVVKQFFSEQNPYWIKWRNFFETCLENRDPAYLVGDELYHTVRPGERGYYAAMYGLRAVLKELIMTRRFEVDAVGGRHGSALQAACLNGHESVVLYLLESGADVNLQSGLHGCALNAAAASGCERVVSLLLEHGADPMLTDDAGRHALYMAARNGNDVVMKRLLEAGVPLDKPQKYGWTPLLIACDEGHAQLVETLLRAGAVTNVAEMDDGVTPLYTACMKGYIQVVEMLLRSGADTSVAATDGWTPLLAACDEEHAQVVEILLRAGADTNVTTTDGCSPLHTACKKGQEQVVSALIGNGADINTRTSSGHTALYLAARSGCASIVSMLLQHGVNPDLAEDSLGWTPLISASAEGHLTVVKALLDAGCDPRQTDSEGGTPLYQAAAEGHLDVMHLLLDSGVDPDFTDALDTTPLHAAAYNGHLHVVKLLMANGAQPKACHDGEWTPLQAACYKGHRAVVEVLLASEPNVAAHGLEKGQPLLNLAAYQGDCELVALLLSVGANINAIGRGDPLGQAPLHNAAGNGHSNMIRYLLDHGADIHVRSTFGLTALHVACSSGHPDVALVLLKAGSDQTCLDERGNTPLSYACAHGRAEVVRTLLRGGANVQVRNKNGTTPLHAAACFGYLECVRLLVEHGADLNATMDHDNKTAADLADEYQEVLEYLALHSKSA